MSVHSDNHWWGFAAMPLGMEPPCHGEDNPMTLVCQFALGEGMVYVFADLDYWFGDLDAQSGPIGEWSRDFFRVLYAPTREDLHVHEIRYPDGTSTVPDERPMNELTNERMKGNGEWRDELAQDYPGYEVLVQLDEDDDLGLRFYDCGTLFFLIRQEDLAARHFENVKCVLYSY